MNRPDPVFDVSAFARDHTRPLTCVSAITEVIADANGVTLHCATQRLQRRYRDRYGTSLEVATLLGPGPVATIRIEFPTEAILRFRFAPGDTVPENQTPMVVGVFSEPPIVQVEATEQQIVLSTAHLCVTLDRAPYRMRVTDQRGTTLVDTIPAAVYQHPPTGESEIGGTSLPDAWPWFFRDQLPLGFVEDPDSGLAQVFDTSFMGYDEHFYGFGEKFGPLDKRGQKIVLWHANPAGKTWPLSYKNIPFFMSTRGYGHFINSAYPITYHMGDLSHTHWTMQVQQGLLDYYLIAGPSFSEILPRYTAITGIPQMPPVWSFGLWMSRMSYQSQEQVETVARELREQRVPCDVIHIDTDWFKTFWVNDLEFSPERFPDPAGMIATLREQGFRTTLWQLPYISTQSRLYSEGVEHGYFARAADGSPRHIDGFFGAAAVIDFSNPAAVEWYTAAFAPLFAMGVAGIKTDFGEGAPIDAIYHGYSGLEMHNLYPLLYNKAIYEYSERMTGEKLIWGRSAYAGSQRYPIYWGGDPAVRWGDLANVLNGGLGLGLCGFPFWSQDIGGFAGTPTPELYIRWAQMGLFMTHPRAHGPIAREPWVFGQQALEIFRRYTNLRYQMLPYIYSEAVRCVATSQPVMRPMLFDWQDDPSTYDISDQFMLGEWLLFAPIVDETNQRRVYLPAGQWMNYWTNEIIEGSRWLIVQAALDELPLFLRAGAIVPMAAPMQHTGECDWHNLTLDMFPAGKSTFTLTRPDGTVGQITCLSGEGRITIELENMSGEITLHLRGIHSGASAALGNQPLALEKHGHAQVCHIPAGEDTRRVEINLE